MRWAPWTCGGERNVRLEAGYGLRNREKIGAGSDTTRTNFFIGQETVSGFETNPSIT